MHGDRSSITSQFSSSRCSRVQYVLQDNVTAVRQGLETGYMLEQFAIRLDSLPHFHFCAVYSKNGTK